MSGGERSAEEREAARLERERRRAKRGRSAAAPLSEEPESRDGERQPELEHEPDHAEHEYHAEESGHDGADGESPAGTRRVSGLERDSRQRRSIRRARSPRRERPPRRAQGRRRGTFHRGRIGAVVAIVLAVALIWFLVQLFQPFHSSGAGRVTVTIPAHSSSTQVGDLLVESGVIASSFFFELRATLAGERGDLRAGTYHLRRDMSYGDVLKILTTPPPAAKTSELTIAEGDTRFKIASLLSGQHVSGNYLAATRHSPLLDPRAYGAPRSLPSLEGFLFPSSYQLRDPLTVSELVSEQLRTFKRRFATVNLSYARSKHLSPFDVLTVASMVQGEAQTVHDMPLIASVIYNRLRYHMPLAIDATTRYATGNYTAPLTVSQLNSPSPYNTRVHPGLPLGPIDNPGMAAIQAAAHPAQTSYLYFVAKVCGNGSSAFASNNAQFQRYVQQYRTARIRRGGHSPTHC